MYALTANAVSIPPLSAIFSPRVRRPLTAVRAPGSTKPPYCAVRQAARRRNASCVPGLHQFITDPAELNNRPAQPGLETLSLKDFPFKESLVCDSPKSIRRPKEHFSYCFFSQTVVHLQGLSCKTGSQFPTPVSQLFFIFCSSGRVIS